jgi:H+/Cl- antiporter ClcA
MNKVKTLLSCALVGVLVAIVYTFFEKAVHGSINFIWDTTFDTDNARWIVMPLSLFISLIFFGLQHYLDPKSENKEEHSLGGGKINASLKNLGAVLLIGYFSLLAGASLGPEAILVPASTITGAYVALKLFKNNQKLSKTLVAASVVALFTAFFHSFFVGVLSLLLIKKISGFKISRELIIVGIVSAASSYFTLQLVDPTNSYFKFPEFNLRVAIIDIVAGIFLIAAGYMATFSLKYIHKYVQVIRAKSKVEIWWKQAIIASLGLSIIYIIGGPLIEFTGNESIVPLIDESASLGVVGLLLVLVTKLFAVGWSKAMGYRGGLIFPMIFVACVLVAISQIYFVDSNFWAGFFAAMIGILAAEKKAKVLL